MRIAGVVACGASSRRPGDGDGSYADLHQPQLGGTSGEVSLRHGRHRMPSSRLICRNVVFAVLGAAALVCKHSYAGVGERVVHSYGGNFVVSFALYFAFLGAMLIFRSPRLLAAAAVLTVVTAFEMTDGFGVMANVYDRLDIAADAAGIGLATLVDTLSWRVLTGSSRLPHSSRPPRVST